MTRKSVVSNKSNYVLPTTAYLTLAKQPNPNKLNYFPFFYQVLSKLANNLWGFISGKMKLKSNKTI